MVSARKRSIEEDAEEWYNQGKPEELAYLLQGSKLTFAEEFIQKYAEVMPLSVIAREFIQLSQRESERLRQEEQQRQQRELEQASRAEKKEQRAVIFISVFSLFSVGFIFLLAQSFRTNVYDIWSNRQVDVTNSANSKTLYDKLNDLFAKAKASHKNRDIDRAIAYSRQVRLETSKVLNNELDNDKLKISKSDKAKFQELSSESENFLAEMIKKYSLKDLPTQLQNLKTQQYKNIPPVPGQLENNFPPGALRTTYSIIMQDLGAKADSNGDGVITSKTEAEQIPCETLKAIQKMWSEITQNRCGFYDVLASKKENIDKAYYYYQTSPG